MRFNNIIGNGNFVAFNFVDVSVDYRVRLSLLSKRTHNALLRACEHGYCAANRGAEATVYAMLAATQELPATYASCSGMYMNSIVPTAFKGKELENAIEQGKAMLAMASMACEDNNYGYSNHYNVEEARDYWLNWRTHWIDKGEYKLLRCYGRNVNLNVARNVLGTVGVPQWRAKYYQEFAQMEDAIRKGRTIVYNCKVAQDVPNGTEVITCHID